MSYKTTAQKKARKMHLETGLPYRTCLTKCIADSDASKAARAAAEIDETSALAAPTGGGLFSHA